MKGEVPMKKLLAAAAAILMLLVSCAPSALANQYEEYLTSAIKDNPEMVDKELDNVIRQYSEDMKSQQKWRQDPENIER